MFNKGERVYLVQQWDDGRKWNVTPAVVHACGRKRMVLEHAETGECLGREFAPAVAQRCGYVNGPATSYVLREWTPEEIAAIDEVVHAYETHRCQVRYWKAEEAQCPASLRLANERLGKLSAMRFTLLVDRRAVQ